MQVHLAAIEGHSGVFPRCSSPYFLRVNLELIDSTRLNSQRDPRVPSLSASPVLGLLVHTTVSA